MKLSLLLIVFLKLGSQAFACDDASRICVNDTVFPDTWFYEGKTVVVAINPHTQVMTVRSSRNAIGRFTKEEVSIPEGCLDGICVNDLVIHDGQNHFETRRVQAINPYKGTVTIPFDEYGGVRPFPTHEISVVDECLDYDDYQRNSYELKN